MSLANDALHLTDAEQREAEALLTKYVTRAECGDYVGEERDEMIALIQLASFGLDWVKMLRTDGKKQSNV